jgi:hypothetical protein
MRLSDCAASSTRTVRRAWEGRGTTADSIAQPLANFVAERCKRSLTMTRIPSKRHWGANERCSLSGADVIFSLQQASVNCPDCRRHDGAASGLFLCGVLENSQLDQGLSRSRFTGLKSNCYCDRQFQPEFFPWTGPPFARAESHLMPSSPRSHTSSRP